MMGKKPSGTFEGGGIVAASPVRLEELVSYQEGAIVSRTIAKKNGGTITLFAFDADQALSEHTAPFDALAMVLEGRAELTIGGQAIRADAGQSVLMPGGVPHAVKAAERFKMLLVMVREVSASGRAS
jgi:quercetin dioxygenase-like cupin family protein